LRQGQDVAIYIVMKRNAFEVSKFIFVVIIFRKDKSQIETIEAFENLALIASSKALFMPPNFISSSL
jgi:hypothetical protein